MLRTVNVSRPIITVLSVTLLVAGASAPAPTASAGEPPVDVVYRPPVDAPVSDPFRAPLGPYGPGNRGLEYATGPGTPATAIGVGVVTFAGQVAGRGVVTVLHPDGLRSSLTGLRTVEVAVGRPVDHSTVLGSTGGVLHLGVRRGIEYLDPALLFGTPTAAPLHAVLVPVPSG